MLTEDRLIHLGHLLLHSTGTNNLPVIHMRVKGGHATIITKHFYPFIILSFTVLSVRNDYKYCN